MHSFQHWLAHRHLPLVLAVLAMLLASPALWTGWQFDDYLQRAQLTPERGVAGLRPVLLDLFIFMDGNPAHAVQKMDRGSFPWWALPEGKVAFWRPFSGLTHWLDYQLWPDQPLLMHAHSLLWFGALVAVVTLLYRSLMGATSVAGLAALLYAFDDAHGFGVAWLSNRNALCATVWGALCVLAHTRWRRTGDGRSGWLAALCLALGMLSAEAALATLAYLLAYTLVLDAGNWRQRLAALAPAIFVVGAWRIAYRMLGYGAWGTSYIDPLGEPLRYVQAVVTRGPLLLLGQWALPPAEIAPFLPPVPRLLLWLWALVVLATLARMLWSPLRSDRIARFWAVGMLLATLPSCAALPANRLLWFIGLGAMGLLGQFLSRQLAVGGRQSAVSSVPATGYWRLRILIALHLILAPLLLPLVAFSPALLGTIEPSLASLPSDDAIAQRDLVIVNAPSFFFTSFIEPIRTYNHQSAPARTLLLGPGLAALTLRRIDRNTLAVRPAGGFLLGFDSVFRGAGHPLRLGQQISLAHVEVSALTPDGRPAEAIFHFVRPLEDPSLQWFVWQAGVYAPFTLPAIGATVELPAANPFAGGH